MITDDEVMRLFERADPARIDNAASDLDAVGDLEPVLIEALHGEARMGHRRRPERPNRPWSRR